VSRLSIRWRLTLWNALALAVLLVGIGAGVYMLLRHALYEQVDRMLAGQFSELERDERIKTDPGRRLEHWAEEFHEHVGVFAVIYDADGNVVVRTRQLADQSVPAFPTRATSDGRYDSSDLPLIGRQRTLMRELHVGERVFTVVLMTPLKETDEELREVAGVLWGILPFALLLAAVFAYLLARRALAPVDQLQRAADGITAERLHERLEIANPGDELGRLGQTINAMIARLERSFNEIRRFTADASHELRTPISVIRTDTEVATANPPAPEEFRALAGSILEECEHLSKLTDQLLTLSREDAGISPPNSAEFDLVPLVRDVVETMRPLADAKHQNIAVETEGDLPVSGDAERIRQVVYNLLDNAIKYTPDDGRIDVSLRGDNTTAVLTVRDTGEGVPAEHLPHVFDRFYRVDKARSREAGGTGLGLSIVQSIVGAHAGTVEMESTANQGTVVTVRIPK